MSVLGIVSEIVENKELKEEESDDKYYRRDKNIWWDENIIYSMDNAGTDNPCPETLNTLDAGVVFPSKCFLTERKVPRIVDKAQEGKSSSSI